MKESRIEIPSWLLLFSLLSFFFVVYSSTLSKNWNFDGVVFAIFLRSAYIKHDIFLNVHFQHLLYQPLVNLLYFILPYKFDYLLFLQLFNMFLSLFVLFFFLKAIKNFTGSIILSLLSSLILGFSFNFWFYATDSEVHMLTYFFIVVSIYFFSIKKYRMSLFFGGLSVLAHILNFFYFMSLIIGFFLKKKIRIKDVLFAGFIPVISYLAFFFYVFKKKLFHLYFSGKNIGFFLKNIDVNSYKDNFSSYTKLFLHLNYRVSVFIGVLIFMIIVYSLFKKRNELAVVVFLFFVMQFLFHLFWEPENPELKSSILVLLIILTLESVPRRKIFAISLFVVFLLFINGKTFYENSKIENNKAYLISEEISKRTEKNSAILIGGSKKGFIKGKVYLPYFFNIKAFSLSDYPRSICRRELNLIIERLDKMRKNENFYVFSDVFAVDEKFCSKSLLSDLKKFILSSSKKSFKILEKYKLYRISD